MDNITIRDIKVLVTAPGEINLVIVKTETSEPEPLGYGYTTLTWRHKAVATAIEEYLCPVLKNKSIHNIEDIWQTMMGSSYWRGGPIPNNAVLGVDETPWNAKGKLADILLYGLFGGKAMEDVTIYRHANGGCLEEVKEYVSQCVEEGYWRIRCHTGTRGGNFDGKHQQMVRPGGAPEGAYFRLKMYTDDVTQLFKQVRKDFRWELEIIYDVHERLSLADTLAFTKEPESFRLFFLEGSLAPDQVGYYKYLREQTIASFAMEELFTSPAKWKTIIQNQWIDFIRVHSSDTGGVAPVVKPAHFCDVYSVRTAWYGPNDLSSIGMCTRVHPDLNNHDLSVQEFSGFTQEEEAIFLGYPKIGDGYAHTGDTPGIGVGFDEKEAAGYPVVDMDHSWPLIRLLDGTTVRP